MKKVHIRRTTNQRITACGRGVDPYDRADAARGTLATVNPSEVTCRECVASLGLLLEQNPPKAAK